MMSDDGRQIVRMTNQELQTMRFDEALEHYIPDLATALPDHIPLDRFKRVVLTAVNQNPELARADRRSLFNSCSRCAHDGLYPDGREAALVVFRTKVKRKVANDNGDLVEREYYADLVQYLPMVAGIRKRMRNTGEVLSADAQIVCRNDKFHYGFGDDPKIEHEPPSLDAERGETIGAYAIIKLSNGEVLREVMSRSQIERVRQMSRAKDGPAWTKSWDEMARKTVLKRCAKAAPTGSEIERLLGRDDEIPQANSDSPLRAIPPRPRPEDYLQIDNGEAAAKYEKSGEAEQAETSFTVTDLFGETHDATTEEDAIETLIGWIGQTQSLRELDGLMESNIIWAPYPAIIEAYKDKKDALSNPGARRDRPASGAPPTAPARDVTTSAGSTGQTEHPEARQSSTPTERREPQADRSVEPRDDPLRQPKTDTMQKLAAAKTPHHLLYFTRKALSECGDPSVRAALWQNNKERYERPEFGAANLAEVKEMFESWDLRFSA